MSTSKPDSADNLSIGWTTESAPSTTAHTIGTGSPPPVGVIVGIALTSVLVVAVLALIVVIVCRRYYASRKSDTRTQEVEMITDITTPTGVPNLYSGDHVTRANPNLYQPGTYSNPAHAAQNHSDNTRATGDGSQNNPEGVYEEIRDVTIRSEREVLAGPVVSEKSSHYENLPDFVDLPMTNIDDQISEGAQRMVTSPDGRTVHIDVSGSSVPDSDSTCT